MNVPIFVEFNFSSLGMLHIILDQFWALNTNPAIFFWKMDIDRYIYIILYIDFHRLSIDQCIDFANFSQGDQRNRETGNFERQPG